MRFGEGEINLKPLRNDSNKSVFVSSLTYLCVVEVEPSGESFCVLLSTATQIR